LVSLSLAPHQQLLLALLLLLTLRFSTERAPAVCWTPHSSAVTATDAVEFASSS